MALFGRPASSVNPMTLGQHAGEIGFNRFLGVAFGSLLTGLGQIDSGQPVHLQFGCTVFVLGPSKIEFGLAHEARWLGSLEENEILVLPRWRERDEIQLAP